MQIALKRCFEFKKKKKSSVKKNYNNNLRARTQIMNCNEAATYSSAGSGAAGVAVAAAAPSPGGGCSAGTAFEDLAGVEVGDTLFVGEPCKGAHKSRFAVGREAEAKGETSRNVYLRRRPERIE